MLWPTRTIRSTGASSRGRWRPWVRCCSGGAAIISLYLLVYLSVRSGHRTPDGRLVISLGSRTANHLFAPAMALEQRLRYRPVPNPETLLQATLAEARSSQTPVLVILGLKSCLPCRQLEQFLEEQRGIVSRHFIVLKANVDDDMTAGTLIRDRYRTRSETDGSIDYFPWIAFLNGHGELLVTADDGPPGRIGIPQGGPQDRAWFLRMLRIANPAISDAELARLDAAAEAYHKRIWRDPAPGN